MKKIILLVINFIYIISNNEDKKFREKLIQKYLNLGTVIHDNERRLSDIYISSGGLCTPNQSHDIKDLNILIAQQKQKHASLKCQIIEFDLKAINAKIQIITDNLNNEKENARILQSQLQFFRSEIEKFKTKEEEETKKVLKYRRTNNIPII